MPLRNINLLLSRLKILIRMIKNLDPNLLHKAIKRRFPKQLRRIRMKI
jgi:hypothetical protein